jgi:hypothetical protein
VWYGIARCNGCTFMAEGETREQVEQTLQEMTPAIELCVIARVEKPEDFVLMSTGLIIPQP